MEVFVVFGGFGHEKTNPIKPNQTQSILAPRFSGGLKGYLKKQSQFAPARIDARSYGKGHYEEFYDLGRQKTKPIQTQSIRITCCVLRTAFWFCHSRGNGNPVFWVVMDSASSAE